MTTALLSTTYFGPVQWYQKLNRYDRIIIDGCEHFVKQSYRNRCLIATTQGVQVLTIPTEHTGGERLATKDVRISDHGNWRHLHWNALVSAYGDSPFFEFYADDIRPFFERRWTFLFDFNLEITHALCQLADLRPNITVAPHYMQADDADDFRTAIQPKHPLPDAQFQPRRYYQVFEQKHGFVANLSILDLLFNMGNESILYL